jgi:hypothetical protein
VEKNNSVKLGRLQTANCICHFGMMETKHTEHLCSICGIPVQLLRANHAFYVTALFRIREPTSNSFAHTQVRKLTFVCNFHAYPDTAFLRKNIFRQTIVAHRPVGKR